MTEASSLGPCAHGPLYQGTLPTGCYTECLYLFFVLMKHLKRANSSLWGASTNDIITAIIIMNIIIIVIVSRCSS